MPLSQIRGDNTSKYNQKLCYNILFWNMLTRNIKKIFHLIFLSNKKKTTPNPEKISLSTYDTLD